MSAFNLPLFDVSARKHGGNEQSENANLVAQPGKAKAREMIYNVLLSREKRGATCREISRIINRPMHSISGRITELIAEGRAKKHEWITRDGGRVIVAVPKG